MSSFFLTKIFGPLLLSSLRAYFTASFPKSNLIFLKKKKRLCSSYCHFLHLPFFACLTSYVLLSSLSINTECVLAFDTKYIKTNILVATDVKIKHIPGQRPRSWNFELSERTERQGNAGSTGLSSLYSIEVMVKQSRYRPGEAQRVPGS